MGNPGIPMHNVMSCTMGHLKINNPNFRQLFYYRDGRHAWIRSGGGGDGLVVSCTCTSHKQEFCEDQTLSMSCVLVCVNKCWQFKLSMSCAFIWVLWTFSHRLPTDIQAEGIPMILGGGDVLMVSWCSLVTTNWMELNFSLYHLAVYKSAYSSCLCYVA